MTKADCYLEAIRQDSFLHTMLISYEHAAEAAGQAAVLDFGCGYGWGSYLLSFHSRHVTGYDPDRQRIELACQVFQRNHVMFLSDTCDLIEQSYDIVCLFMVLPYVENGLQILNQAASYLRPSGTLWISYKSSTPTISDLLRCWSATYNFSNIYSDQRCLSKAESVLEHVYCKKTG